MGGSLYFRAKNEILGEVAQERRNVAPPVMASKPTSGHALTMQSEHNLRSPAAERFHTPGGENDYAVGSYSSRFSTTGG
jgi:hypothetical protein